MLVISVIAVLLPAAFNAAFSDNLSAQAEQDRILKMSRGTAVILLVIYLAYRESKALRPRVDLPLTVSLDPSVAFQLFTHPHLYADGDADPDDVNVREGRAIPLMKRHRAFKPAKSVAKERRVEEGLDEEEEEEELPQLNVWVALGLLVVVTVLVARGSAEWSSE